jgi:hypothetical protein
MDAADTWTKRERFPKRDGESRPDEGGGCPKTTRAGPHRTPCQLRRRGRMGQGAFWKRFFGALDGLSRRTLTLLPASDERPSETPLFDSTPPAGAAMVVTAVYGRPARPFSRRQEIALVTHAAMAVSQYANDSPCVTPRMRCDAAKLRSTTMLGCGSLQNGRSSRVVRGCRCYGVVPTFSRHADTIAAMLVVAEWSDLAFCGQ